MEPTTTPEVGRWRPADYAVAAVLAAAVLFTNLSTVLNNAYSYGETLFDSTIFQTIGWRSGWALLPAPTIDDVSFLNNHLSLINYVPSLLSYCVPIDRMTFFGLVYGIVYAGLALVAYSLFRRAFGGSALLAMLATVAFYLSGAVMSGQWEPHQEIASPLFMAMFFLGWATRRRALAIVGLLLNASVREDCGLLLALPLVLLAADEWLQKRRGSLDASYDTSSYAALSFLLSVAAFAVKKTFFHDHDAIATYYYSADWLAHLTAGVFLSRLADIATGVQYVWLPGAVLIVAALALRDARLAIGWVAFVPYWLFNFFSQMDQSAVLQSYKSFPYILSMLWPAIIALRSPAAARAKLGWVQVLVLAAGLISLEDGGVRLGGPDGMEARLNRWTLRPETFNAEIYRDLEAHLDPDELGATVATEGVLALYPYSFAIWFKSGVANLKATDAPKYDSVFWFVGDREQAVIPAWLDAGHFPYFYRVVGTRIRLATRKPPDALRTLGPMLTTDKAQ